MRGQAKLLELFFLIGLFLYIFVNAKVPKVEQEVFVDVPNFLEFEKIKEYALQFDINSIVNIVDDIVYPNYVVTDVKFEVFEPFSILADINVSNYTLCFAYNFPNSLNPNSVVVYHKDEILKTQVIFEWYQVKININTSVVGSEKTIELSLNLTFPEAITCSSISLFYENEEIPIYLEGCDSFFINGTINITFTHLFEYENETFYLLASRNNLIKGLRVSGLSPDISVEYNYTQPEKSNRGTVCFKIPENITDFDNFILYYNYRKESYPQYQLLNKSYESIYEEFRIPIVIDNSENNENLKNYQIEIRNPYYNEKGLIVHIPFNEGTGTTAKDLSSFGNDMSFINYSLWTDGKFGNASYFNGSNYGVIYGNSILNNMSVLTLSFWFKTNETQSYKFIVEKEGTSGYCWGGYLTNNSNTVSFYVKDSDGNVYYIYYTGNFADDNWHFFTGTFDGRHIYLYVDGELVNQSDLGKYVDICNEQGNLYVGAWYSNNKFFIGAVDELRIYNRVLSSEEVYKLYLAKIRPDYENIGFFYINGTSIPFWMEKSGVFWLKMQMIHGNSQEHIYLAQKNQTVNRRKALEVVLFYDDFSTDPTDRWIVYRYSNDTSNEFYWDSDEECLYITKAVKNKGAIGFMKYNGTIDTGFKIRFNFKIGGGSGADGLAFSFFKDMSPFVTYNRSSAGGRLALDAYNGTTFFQSKGYVVEFDNWDNGAADPSANHIAITETFSSEGVYDNQHYSYYNTLTTEDNKWHTAEIKFDKYSDHIMVYLDGNLVIDLQGSPFSDYGYNFSNFSISAGTGGATNNHIIDNILLVKYTDPEPSVIIGDPEIYEVPMYNSTDLLLEGYEVKIRSLAPNKGSISRQLGGFGVCKREVFYENTTIIFEICLGKR